MPRIGMRPHHLSPHTIELGSAEARSHTCIVQGSPYVLRRKNYWGNALSILEERSFKLGPEGQSPEYWSQLHGSCCSSGWSNFCCQIDLVVEEAGSSTCSWSLAFVSVISLYPSILKTIQAVSVLLRCGVPVSKAQFPVLQWLRKFSTLLSFIFPTLKKSLGISFI